MPIALYKELKDNEVVKRIHKGKGKIPLPSLIEEAVMIATSYQKNPRSILVVKQNLYHAQRLYERMVTYLSEENCVLFGCDESLRVEAIASSPEMMAHKVETLASLVKDPYKVVITSVSGLVRHLPSVETFKQGCMTLRVGDVLDMGELKRRLLASGYYQASHIDQPLSFASRGGIVDLYSINYDLPIRVEFFDDEIDSIRFFDTTSQKTVEAVNEVEIVPATDLLFTSEDIQEIEEKALEMLELNKDPMLEASIDADLTLLKEGVREPSLYPYMAFLSKTSGIEEYLQNPLFIYSDEEMIQESYDRLKKDTVVYIQEMAQEKKMLPRFAVFRELERIGSDCKKMVADPYMDNISNIEEIHLPEGSLDQKLSLLKNEKRVLFALNEKEMERVIECCTAHNLHYHLLLEDTDFIQDGFNMVFAPLAQGFNLDEMELKVITAYELYEIRRVSTRFAKKFKSAEELSSYDELQQGDYIVHAQYGVGQYLGIQTRTIQGVKRDFLKCVYRGNAELLVPLEQFRLVRKFVSRDGYVPRLHKLGSNEWEKTKEALQENVNDIAKRLVKLYANRKEEIGYAYQKDSELQIQFEKDFEYELTKDQQSAVEDVKRDMESSKPMDRLICGDVGFGKTEVAIRAAFKAAAENKQVAVLCPTTILAEQHYHTFAKRFKEYPFTVAVLDRFVLPKDVKTTLQNLKDGRIDILIGTHRILSKDVQFKDLGLLVVDEEQRFGVEHKERIKEYKTNVDVLTLSATPIPRTMQMSLVGIRQLSLLETPPANRYNVQTYVVEKKEALVVEAIEKELARNGQVFYLYNKVETIYQVAHRLEGLLVDAKVGVVHGQMDRESIEDVMLRFTNHELNVLVCTTIVENGIDIPNANTILIENAQNFGLAQIYQIKGRVGRSDRIAYAYLLVPPRASLSETASKRLTAVKEFAKLGSGYKIAMRDLTIRGAGNLLGANQSGFIDTVGIDMYIEMLEEAIQAEQGIVKEKVEAPRIANIKQTSYIPKSFAPDDFDKITMYQKIDSLVSFAEIDDFETSVIDQYGRLPKEVKALFDKKKLQLLLNQPHVLSYKELNQDIEIVFTKEFSNMLDGVRLFEIFTEISKEIDLRYTGGSIIATLPKSSDAMELAGMVIERSKEALKDAD